MLTRNLLYTGLTRAQELAVIVGDRRALRWGCAGRTRRGATRAWRRWWAASAGT